MGATEVAEMRSARQGAANGLRAAGQEAVLEAERTRLTAQRAVLERELVEQEVMCDRCNREHKAADVAAQVAKADCGRLDEKLRRMIERVAQLTGELEASRIFCVERNQIACTMEKGLGSAQALTEGLLAQLNVAQCKAQAAHSETQALALHADRQIASHVALQRVARNLVEDLRVHAATLADSIDYAVSMSDTMESC